MTTFSEEHMRQLFSGALQGKNGHVNPIIALEGLTAEVASLQVDGSPHTIVQLLSHLNYWQQRFVAMLSHMPLEPASSAALGWQREKGCTQLQLDELISAFRDSLSYALAKLEDNHFDINAKYGHYPSGFALFQSMASHVSYHTGEIVLLRRILGSWPPPSGGDTW